MSQIRARDLMTTQVITIKPTDTVRQAIIKMAIDNVSGAPVVDNRSHVLGILSQTDVLKLILKYQQILDEKYPGEFLLNYSLDSADQDSKISELIEEFANTKVETMMNKDVLSTTPDAKIIDVLKILMEANIGRVPVLEKGVLVGTVSRSDIIFALYKRKS